MNQSANSLILSYGSHNDDSDAVCLLEAVSLPPGVLPAPGVHRTDHPDDTCPMRAAFGRALNDSYGTGAEANAERTEDCKPLVDALRGTVARQDGERTALHLWDLSLHHWYPSSIDANIVLLRAACAGLTEHPAVLAACEKAVVSSGEMATTMRALPEIKSLAALAALAARAALAADPSLSAALTEWSGVRRRLRREMSTALLATCRAGWSVDGQIAVQP